MSRVLLCLLLLGGCDFDWDAFDPRLETRQPPVGMGGNGGDGGSGGGGGVGVGGEGDDDGDGDDDVEDPQAIALKPATRRNPSQYSRMSSGCNLLHAYSSAAAPCASYVAFPAPRLAAAVDDDDDEEDEDEDEEVEVAAEKDDDGIVDGM